MTRDQEIAESIAAACRTLARLGNNMERLAQHALGEYAIDHAAMYEVVAEKLERAREIAADAGVIMEDGDPADYALDLPRR